MSVTTAQAVALLENVLFESSTLAQANAATWVANSQNVPGEGTVLGLATAMAASPEASIVQQVVRYYEGALGRAPGGAEIAYYVNIVEAGLSSDQITQGASSVSLAAWNVIAGDFANSPEFQTIASSSDVVTLLYLNILGRTPAASEVAFYQAQIAQGYTPTLLVQEFTNSPEYQTEVGSDISGALVNYGTAVSGGTTLTTIPLQSTAHLTTVNLGSDALTVTGGPVTQEIIVLGAAATAAQAAVTAVTGVIGVTGVTAATGVTGVTSVTAVSAVTGQSAVTAVTDGAVTVTDFAFGAGGKGTLATVNLANTGAGSVINDNALSVLDLTGTAGTLAINNNATGTLTLNMSVNGLSAADNTITDTNAEVVTLNIAAITADSTLKAFIDSNLTTLNVTGPKKLTLLTINSSLTTLNVTADGSFSDGATTHATGLAALGKALTITHSSSGSFSAALDDTTQSFTGTGSGADIITVSSLADATQTFTAGSSTANEIVFEGGAYALSSTSKGKFVNFQTVGVAGNVSGTIDLAVVDPTATGLEVRGANVISFIDALNNTALTLDAAGASVTIKNADSSGASDSIGITMSAAATGLVLQDSAGAGIGTVSIANSLAAGETSTSAAHAIGAFTDNSLATLNLTGSAGLTISSLSETGASLTLNNGSTNGNGLAVGSLTDTALASLTFSGSGVTSIGTVTDSAASLAIANNGAALQHIDTVNDDQLTSLTLAANVALGQTSTALTSNGLQDASTAGVSVVGGSDNAHATINLTAGAASGKTDTITLGNGNNVVADASAAGTVIISLGSGANLVELGASSLDTTATYSVTLAARAATPVNEIFIGADGINFASAPNLTVTGATTGDIIAFGNDTASSAAALTATVLTSATSVTAAIAALEALATTAHKVVYGVYGGNTYVVETATGTLGKTDTTVVELAGTQTLTASTGYVTVGGTASTIGGSGGLSGSGFTIPAGTATNLALGAGANVVNMVGASTGVTDTFTSIAGTTGLTINYQATSGTDTIQMGGSAGSSKSDVTALSVNDSSTGSAGLTIGAFTDSNLTSVTYNNSAATGAVMTQSALTSSTLNTINLTGGVASQATNVYFISAALSTQGTVTVNDGNIGTGTTTMGLTLNDGPSALTLNMTGADTLATGALTDDRLATLNLTGSGAGKINVGALSDAIATTFTVNDTSTSTGASVIVLSGLAAAAALTVNDSSAGTLTDSSTYADPTLATLALGNTGGAALTIGGGGIGTAALTSVTVTGSGSGSITTGTLNDTGAAALTITDSDASTGLVTLPLDGVSAATAITVNDSAAGGLALGNIADAGLITLSLTDTGAGALTAGTITAAAMTSMTLTDNGAGSLTVGAITANAMTSLTFTGGSSGTISIGAITDDVAAAVTITDASSGAGATSLTIASLANATALTVKDSASGALTIAAFAANDAATLTFNNTGAGALTASGITDNAAALTLAVTGSGAGSEAITLTAGGATSLTITDTSAATGTTTVTPDMTGGAASLTVTDSAAGGLTIGAVTDLNLTQATLTNTGGGTLGVGAASTGITGGAAFDSLTFQGSGTVTTSMITTANSGNIDIGSGNSGTVTLTNVDVGTTVTDAGNLIIAATAGNLTIAGGTTYLLGIGIGNTGTGLINATLTNLATAAETVVVDDSGRTTLNLTDTVAATTLTQSGSGNLNLTLNDNGSTSESITLGGGSDTITMTASRTVGSTFTFSVAPGSNLNVSPVTADIFDNFLTDTATVQGDLLSVGLTTANILSSADASNLWTISAGGMMTKAGASVLNFIAFVQGLTQVNGASVNGIAGFYDGANSWLAYNDHAGHVSVIEVAGVHIAGIEAGASLNAGFVHII